MFQSARFKLTAFYLAILLGFSLVLTIGVRMLADHAFDASNVAQRGEVHDFAQLGLNYFVPHPENTFDDVQKNQSALVRRHLNEDLLMLNLGALIIGGLLSYWYAGKTLRPIIEAHETQARFASDASHELRTPLANMQVENEVFLRQKSFSEADAREVIRSNLEEVRRLERLSNDLLALTQYGGKTLTLGGVSVRKAVDEALQQVRTQSEARAVHFEQNIDEAQLHGHQESITRLFVILLDNAIKYGPEKGAIYIAGAQHANQYVLTIRDEGPGIAVKDRAHIFDRLYRGDTARTKSETSGYGLGLALAKEIVDANHGDIKAYNHERGGAVFSVQLGVVK